MKANLLIPFVHSEYFMYHRYGSYRALEHDLDLAFGHPKGLFAIQVWISLCDTEPQVSDMTAFFLIPWHFFVLD